MPRKWGQADFRELKKLQDRLLQLENNNFEEFCNAAAKELAARLLALVIPATPVGNYPEEAEKKAAHYAADGREMHRSTERPSRSRCLSKSTETHTLSRLKTL